VTTPLNITNITPPRVPIIDERTGFVSREWYRFFLNLFMLTGSGQNQTSLVDLQIESPPLRVEDLQVMMPSEVNTSPSFQALESQIAELWKQVDALSPVANSLVSQVAEIIKAVDGSMSAPPLSIGTLAIQNADNVAIGGGNINGTVIGNLTRADAAVKNLAINTAVSALYRLIMDVVTNSGPGGISVSASGRTSADNAVALVKAIGGLGAGNADVFEVNVGGQTSVYSGSAATPGLSTINDRNTGLWFPAADTVEIVTGGSAAVRYKSDGFEYNTKKQVYATTSPWPGLTTNVPNFAYRVLSLSTVPVGQEYFALFSGMIARTSVLTDITCTGFAVEIGQCDSGVADGDYTNQTVNPSGYAALSTHISGWEATDPGAGYTPYNNGGGLGYLFPKCMSFPIPFTFNTGGKKLVIMIKLYGTSGSILMNESVGNLRIYQVTSSSP